VKAALLLHGDQGEMVHERLGKHPYSCFFRHTFLVVDLHPFHAAAWGIAFEDESAQTFFFQLLHPAPGPTEHPLGEILTASDSYKPWGFGIAHKPHRLARYVKSALHLRANRDILHILSQRIREIPIVFVPPSYLTFCPIKQALIRALSFLHIAPLL